MSALKLNFPLAIILILLFCYTSFSQNKDPNRELIEKTKEYPNADVVVLYDSTEVDVKESGLSRVEMHKLTKILTWKGAKQYRHRHYNYDPQSAAIDIISAKIYRKDGSVEKTDTSSILDYTAPARMIYWGMRNKTLEFGRLEPGDAIETVIHRKGFTYALLGDSEGEEQRFVPPMKGHYYDIVHFRSSAPVEEKVYRIFMPKDKPLQYEVYNGELTSYIRFHQEKDKDITLQVNPHKKTYGTAKIAHKEEINRSGKTEYCWYKKDMQPFSSEPNMVNASNVAPKLLMSTSPDWYAKAVWFHNVNEDFGSFEVTQDVQEKTDELLKGVDDEMEKIKILTHWVAENIRYSGLSMGEGEGYTLHTGKMTFTDRCGVCKDKAGMLVTMLRAAGFESYPAMTMAGSRIDRIPADQFNHSVTLAKLSDGDWILLDPTWVPGVRELWSSAEQQQQLLMGIPGGADLMTTPVSPAENHYLNISADTELKKDGTLKGKITIEAEGQTGALIRRAFLRSFKSSRDEYFPQLFADISPKAEITSLTHTDPSDISEPFNIELSFRIPDYAFVTEDKLMFKPITAENPFDDYFFGYELEIDTNLQEREYGFRIRCSKLVKINETMKLPDYQNADKVPEFEVIEGSYEKGDPASFESEYKIEGNNLKFSVEHRMEKRIYKPEDWDKFKAALVQRKKLSDKPVILKR